eukprot:15305754-Alexandrium_andersonii.AAC.1
MPPHAENDGKGSCEHNIHNINNKNNKNNNASLVVLLGCWDRVGCPSCALPAAELRHVGQHQTENNYNG